LIEGWIKKDGTKPAMPLANIEGAETLSVATCGMYALPENLANPENSKTTISSHFFY